MNDCPSCGRQFQDCDCNFDVQANTEALNRLSGLLERLLKELEGS